MEKVLSELSRTVVYIKKDLVSEVTRRSIEYGCDSVANGDNTRCENKYQTLDDWCDGCLFELIMRIIK